ncbi:putative sulfate transporter [Sphaerosporella brunnea]|uniref:Putative sulfate transporter n=1 Tax=Sphaerosporella brunnea TaxID=1250544 RepID=A0A5J5EX43_9PEZI|nr:putative sulfate transporter [Sphaerosporella brunnea]
MSPPGSSTGSSAPMKRPLDPRARLLSEEFHDGIADHGTFSPTSIGSRPESPSGGSVRSGFTPGFIKRAAATAERAEEAGVKRPWLMYMSYYIPCIAWVQQYKMWYLIGDIAAGITMASFYIPMALSLSANLAHLPAIHGLYAFAVQPLVYALLGSCPTMAVGPEAAGSLLMGNAIRMMNEHHTPPFDNGEGSDYQNARLAATITAMTGAIALLAGFLRLGFLDSVLSRPLLRGFVSGVGFVIFVDQLLPEMGLIPLAKKEQVTHVSTLEKLWWIVKHVPQAHALTLAVAGVSFSVIMLARIVKQRIAPRRPWIHFLPDRFLVVVLSAVLTYVFRWDLQGLEILGKIEAPSGHPFNFQFPFEITHLNHVTETFSTAFLISVLGFFESVVAAKALGTNFDVSISSNRELMALGTANILGGCFGALPAFGGYGRSKVNKATGGRTPLSSIVLSLCTVLCVLFLLPYFHYLPRCVLSAMISVVGISLLEEAPHDVIFFSKIRAYSDLATMALVFLTTLVWSISTGIAVGVGISLITVLKHSTRARIQILGRDPLSGHWRPIEESTALEQTPQVLVIKIRESLTFANAGDLSRRLWRIDRYGDTRAHPSLPRLKQGVRGVVFDVAGVASMDGSGAQCVSDTVQLYVQRGVRVWFARVGSEVGERMRRARITGGGGLCQVVDSVDEAVRREDAVEEAEGGV